MFCDDTVLNKLLTHLIKIIFENENYGGTTELLCHHIKKSPQINIFPIFGVME